MPIVVPNAHTTDEYWEIDDVSLNQYGWNIATFGGSRYDLPPKRGEDIRYAYRPGALHRPKIADSRTISLVMWVSSVDPATGNTVGCSPNSNDPGGRRQWNDNWDFLRRLVWKPQGGQVRLTRRWWQTTNDGTGASNVVAADGLAEIADTMSPTMTGRQRAEFQMNLLMADPFFYGRGISTVPDSKVVRQLNTNTNLTVFNAGHDIAAHGDMEVKFVGPLTDPAIANNTASPGVFVKYKGFIATGQTVTLTVSTFQASILGGAYTTPHNVLPHITHSGSRFWFGLLPGNNTIAFRDTNVQAQGQAIISFRPPYV